MKILLALALAGCASPTCPAFEVTRDVSANPAIVDQATFTRLFAISDIHGGYDRAVALLVGNGLVAAAPASPAMATWSGGDATLVVTGDLIDKGAQSVEVVDLFRALGSSASAGGGRLIVTLGNHEAEFLADPHNSKADAFDGELQADGLDPCVVATTDPRGTWLRSLPFGARVGDWFFAHAGDTHGQAIGDLERFLDAGLTANGFRDAAVIGADSILESRAWWDAAADVASTNAAALGVGHVVFGHTPDALGARGAIAVGPSGLLFRIDVGMSPAVNDSDGALLAITHAGTQDVATQLDAAGLATELWRGPAP